MRKILHIVGNRPQFIKLAVLYNALARDGSLQQQIIHTGQHFDYQMSDIFFEQLNIPLPTLNLNIQNNSANLFIATAAEGLQNYFSENKKSIVFVYGDTNSTLAAAMAAKRCNLPLVHFEAGVRTAELSMPEEINRVLTDRLSDINYCCTKNNLQTMINEGFGSAISSQVILSGDLMLDAFNKIAGARENVTKHKQYVACTIHRAATLSSKDAITNIINALNKINRIIPVVMPLHPHTKKKIAEYGVKPKFTQLSPLGYPAMKTFLANSTNIITDSGGVSREAYFSKKKSLIIMDKPFWPEIITQQCSLNCSPAEFLITEKFNDLHTLTPNFDTNIFGNGNAALIIQKHLSAYFKSI